MKKFPRHDFLEKSLIGLSLGPTPSYTVPFCPNIFEIWGKLGTENRETHLIKYQAGFEIPDFERQT